jgi:hypothetical protein
MNALAPSSDPRWAAWARPLAAFLRGAVRPVGDCTRFCAGLGVSALHAANALSWLDLEGYARTNAGTVALTPAGEAWVADERVELVLLPPARPLDRRAPRALDLRPFTYGRLHPIERAGRNTDGHAIWLCACECGGPPITVQARHLRSGNTRSCGCLLEEFRASGRPSSQWRVAS